MNTPLVPFHAGSPIMVAGPTGSGKTYWTTKLLKNEMFTEHVSSVLYCYGASSLLASAEPQGITGEPQQQPKQGVGELLQQMSEGRLSTEAIEINPEEAKSIEKPITVENVFEEEN